MSRYQKVDNDCPYCKCPTRHETRTQYSTAAALIDEVMKKYFCEKAGQGSSCSLFSNPKGSVYSMDRRLKYWGKILEDRKRIACRIQKATGKRLSHVLYNQIEEHRNIQNVKRIMDYAERLDPAKLATRKISHIQDPNLFETLPRSERLQAANLEIVGTPTITMNEQWIRQCGDSNNSFLTSKFLQRKLKSKTSHMVNILDFYPEIERLQVVGHRIHKHDRPATECISNFELSEVSSDSLMEPWQGTEYPEYCIKLNDITLRYDKKYNKPVRLHLDFKCKPFERVSQSLCKIKNIGRKPVNLVWIKIKRKGAAYLPPDAKVFKFNGKSFRVTYSESENIEVSFMSDKRLVQEELWWLKTEPNFFRGTSQILAKLSGECYIPNEYFSSIIWEILDAIICTIIPGTVCEVRRRVQTEKEIFEKLNPGFKCEPEDLRNFKEIYRQVKKKANPSAWDLNLQTLKEIIESILDFNQRSKYLAAFKKSIRDMRRRIPDCDSTIKVLLARGLIITILDKWEFKAAQIVEVVAHSDIDVLVIKMPFDFVIEKLKQCETDAEKRNVIQYNALYIQMYCSLCDLADDIVSFMQNCLLLYAY